MDGIVSFLGKIALTVVCTLFMLTIGAVVIQLGEKNDYQQYANNSIERFGGLTNEALTDIENYSNDNFNGRFVMQTSTGKKSYGEDILYKYQMIIKPVFMDFEVIKLNFKGSASSKVR
ncbi:hypothetical protein [Lysinibacillus fusiformis]|uniref:hypothetical protein n=1 Tax=Lysinibacillus fusiformis TaxID=28031 RepID=UPI000D34167F|nr:hypothetical protein [Lysinibacillus fusiformis]MED4672379.1 hypothetical protein [Lysinibacillus fusiformis]RDV32226.1 hypothetical protein C7B90_10905 [Lysinibacillus fusiformis]GED65580.1 hypothetical protein LFU01_40320 [Lysinibacillus fusiformis]